MEPVARVESRSAGYLFPGELSIGSILFRENLEPALSHYQLSLNCSRSINDGLQYSAIHAARLPGVTTFSSEL